MGNRLDQIEKNQAKRKAILEDWDAMADRPPSIYDTDEVKDSHKKEKDKQATFLLECQGVTYEIDLLKRALWYASEMILDLTGVKRQENGKQDLKDVTDMMDVVIEKAHGKQPKPKHENNVSKPTPIDEELARKQAEEAAESLKAKMINGPIGTLLIAQNHDLDEVTAEVEEVTNEQSGANSIGDSDEVTTAEAADHGADNASDDSGSNASTDENEGADGAATVETEPAELPASDEPVQSEKKKPGRPPKSNRPGIKPAKKNRGAW